MASVFTVTTVVPARAASRPASSPVRLGAGLTYERITDRTGPVVVHVVRLDPLQATTVDLGAGGPTMGSFSRPSVIGRAHGALIAINGDFGLLEGYPIHPFLMDGTLMGRGVQNGTSFAVAHDETTAFVGPPHPVVDGLLETGNVGFPVSGWNSHRPLRMGSRRSRGTGEASTGLPTAGARRGSMRTGRWGGPRSRQGCRGATRSTSSDASLRRGGWDLGGSCSRRGAGGKGPTRSRRCSPAIASASRGRSGGRGCSTRSAACHGSSTTAGPLLRGAGRRSAGANHERASGSRATAGCCSSSSTAGRGGRSA